MADVPILKGPVAPDKIRLYVVGIYFIRDLDFVPDHGAYMTGHAIAAAARLQGLTINLSPPTPAMPPKKATAGGHIEFVSYVPKPGDPMRHEPSGGMGTFPYYGITLALQEVANPVTTTPPQTSLILQYSVDGPGPEHDTQGSPQFGPNGFHGGSFIRVRLISIYDATVPVANPELKTLGRSKLI